MTSQIEYCDRCMRKRWYTVDETIAKRETFLLDTIKGKFKGKLRKIVFESSCANNSLLSYREIQDEILRYILKTNRLFEQGDSIERVDKNTFVLTKINEKRIKIKVIRNKVNQNNIAYWIGKRPFSWRVVVDLKDAS